MTTTMCKFVRQLFVDSQCRVRLIVIIAPKVRTDTNSFLNENDDQPNAELEHEGDGAQ